MTSSENIVEIIVRHEKRSPGFGLITQVTTFFPIWGRNMPVARRDDTRNQEITPQ